MNEENKTKSYFHFGRIIIIIIIIIILFKIDLKSVIKSPQLQNNITYIKEQGINIWEKYLLKPISNTWDNLLKNLMNKGIDKVQEKIDTSLENLKQ